CLVGFTRRYMDALAHHDPSRVPFARHVKFTENDVVMPIGAGLWGSIGRYSPDALTAADTRTGNAAWFGLVWEHGTPAYYAMRLTIRDGEITQVETVIERKPGLPAPFGDPAKYTHDPAFQRIEPPAERRGRQRLRDVVNGYFSTVSRNDGELLTHFAAACGRTENGISTTSGSFGSAGIAQGCAEQFKLGIFKVNKRVRERRYPLIDTKRGVVVATGFFDHDNSFDTYKTTDGKTHRTVLKWPNSISLMEAFKIVNGKIYRVEAIFTYVPYFMHSPWAGDEGAGAPHGPGWDIAHAADRAAPPAQPAQRARSSCDRACLIGFANRYMSALAKHDDRHLPWARVVDYSENEVPMMIGDGQWGTVVGFSPHPLYAADPATGNVAWLGVVSEHGQPAYYGMRLKVEHGRIAEVEAVIDPKAKAGPFGDPDEAVHDASFGEIEPAGERSSREQLIELVNGYFSTLQRNDGTLRTRLDPHCERVANGLSTTQGSYGPAAIAKGCKAQLALGLFRLDDRLRARRFPIVDVARGVVVATACIDYDARHDRYVATDGKTHSAAIDHPHSRSVIEVFKIRHGAIYRIEAVSTLVPYRMPSPWVR
ncbi:MAG: hypothetical protein ACREU3_06115, partial [Steroidobacteraceae bacterium]